MHNAALIDEQTGETLLLWAVLTESPRFQNTVTSEPIDIGRVGGAVEALGDHIHFEPAMLDVALDLTGHPGRPAGTIGGEGYDVEQYNKLVDFSNRKTTFSYVSYLFVNQRAMSDTVHPGLTFSFLALTDFHPIKGRKGINIIGARLRFQSVVITEDGDTINDPDEAYDHGEQALRQVESTWNFIKASIVGMVGAGLLLGGVGTAFAMLGAAAAGVVAGAFVGSVLGRLFTSTGSVPRQRFKTEIEGQLFEFELRSNTQHDFVTFSMSHVLEGEYLVRERRITYGEDLLAGVTHWSTRGLHIAALDPTQQEIAVTTENLGRTVYLFVVKEI